jgi:hypothetical protein
MKKDEAFLPTPPNPRGEGLGGGIGLVLLQENNSGKLIIFQTIINNFPDNNVSHYY